MAQPGVTITEARSLDGLPPAALALLGQDAFSTKAWLAATLQAALPAGACAAFQVAAADARVLAVLPMLRQGRRLAALATPYTCLWRPLAAPDCTAAELRAAGQALAVGWRRAGVVRLAAMPAEDAAVRALLDGLRAGGLRVLPFAHFGNWHEDVRDLDWDGYLAGRERRLRSAIQRQTRRARLQPGFAFELVRGLHGLDDATAAYEAVYAASWKQAEPYPHFNPALMRACAADATLRLGVLRLGGAPAAAQLWLVHRGWAGVLKLAYDERFKALAPGNVLTGLMLRQVIETDRVAEIDFGRGDDEYKRLWAATRRQRVGALVVDPLSPSGAYAMARHAVGSVRRYFSSARNPT